MPTATLIAPLGHLIHIDEAKAHLRVDGVDEDAFIKSCAASAVQAAEIKTQRQLLHARHRLTLNRFHRQIRIPHAPCVNIVSVQYIGLGGALSTVDPSVYVVNMDVVPATISLAHLKSWPIAMPQQASVFVTYEAGYASPILAQSGTGNMVVNGPYAYAVGQRVTFSNSGGALPSPLSSEAAYLIASVSGSTYTLTDTYGAAIAFTTAGTGRSFIGEVPSPIVSWIKLRIGSLFESREETAPSARTTIEFMPFVDSLLQPYKVWGV